VRSEGERDLDAWRQIVSRPYPPKTATQLADCSEKARDKCEPDRLGSWRRSESWTRRCVCQTLRSGRLREFGPRGIHVAHVIIDGSIEGDKIFSKIPDIGQQRDRTACCTLMRSLAAIGIYIRNIVLLGRRSSMCVHMQKPFEPRAGPFHLMGRVVIFLVWVCRV
jgi:hypothetical protein